METNIINTQTNIDNAGKEINQANDLNKSSGNMINKMVYIAVIVVVVMILLAYIMPS